MINLLSAIAFSGIGEVCKGTNKILVNENIEDFKEDGKGDSV